MTQSDDYVLGTHDEELQRLGEQHQLWRAQAYDVWEKAGIAPGRQVLDIGCGPGFATADLSALVGSGGHVTGVDASAKYVQRVKSLGLGNVDTHVGDVQELNALNLQADHFDAAYARWVMCFVPRPESVIDGVSMVLRHGGRFIMQDYYNYAALKLAPRSEIFEHVIRAVAKSWRDHGGDPDIGCRLPTLLERAGLRVTRIEPILRLAKSSEPLWHWPTTFFRIFVPTLVESGYLTEQDREAFNRDWQAHSDDPHAFFTSPPMLNIVATKD